MRRLVALLALLALAGCGSSKTAAPTTATTTAPEPATTSAPVMPKPQPIDPLRHPAAGRVKVRITAPTHRPKANARWRYTVTVTAGGKPQPARVYLQITFKKTVVGTVGSHLLPKGRWTETIRWPAASRGHPLVFEAKVTSNGRIGGAVFPVVVQ